MKRRFFPVSPTQQIPGRTVDIEGKVLPVADYTGDIAPAARCDVAVVVWAVVPQYNDGVGDGAWADWSVPQVGSEVALLVAGDGGFVWSADPGPDTFISVRVPGYYDWQPPEDWPRAVQLIATARGADVSGVSWVVERGSDLHGVVITDSGPLLVITIPPRVLSDDSVGFDDISLVAHCGGAEVGALRLQVYLDGW